MIYIFTLFAIVVLFIYYDLSSKPEKDIYFWYKILLIWFICVSGFAYNIGSDTIVYMYEYDTYRWSDINDISDLTNFRHRQPGWVFLNLLCKLVTSNYVFLQFVCAIFFNVVFFSFIKKHSNHLFLGILFYAVALYLNMNFNILRQSFAMCFFLLGYDYLIQNKLLKYYIFAIIAFSFHTSAIILFVVPLFSMIKLNKRSLRIIGIILLALVIVLLNTSLRDYFEKVSSDLLMEEGTLLTIGEAGNKFIRSANERTGTITVFGLIETLLRVAIIIFVVLYNYTHNKKSNKYWNSMVLLYCICRILDMVIPVMFYRFMLYFTIFYYCTLSYCIVDLGSKYAKRNKLIIAVACFYFATIPIRSMMNSNTSTGIPLMAQFHPYYTIFDKTIDPVRASQWGSHK